MASIENHDAIVIRSRFPIDKAFLDTAQHLRFIARVGSGLENIDVAYAKSLGIEIIRSPEGNANAVGNHALAMLLGLLNNCLLYTSPSPRDRTRSRMPSSA